jgi:hypothetical protein
MKTTILSTLVTVLAVSGIACGKSTREADNTVAKAPAAAAGQISSKSEIASKAREDWLVIDDKDYIPVIDDLSRKMQSAREAFVKKEPATAAAEIRAAADLLSKEIPGAPPEAKENIDATTKQLSSLAADLDNGKAVGLKRFDKAIAMTVHADRDRDLLVLDESSWYPYINEPDRHFQNAHRAFLAKDYEKAAQEIRKGEAYVKLEASHARGDVKHSLNASAQELEILATDMEKGMVKDVKDADNRFGRADLALAQSHQTKAKETWAKKETVRTGDEMNAGALFLEQSAHWTASEARSGVSAVVGDTRMLAGKLAEGSKDAVEGVEKGIDNLGKAVSDLGRKA